MQAMHVNTIDMSYRSLPGAGSPFELLTVSAPEAGFRDERTIRTIANGGA